MDFSDLNQQSIDSLFSSEVEKGNGTPLDFSTLRSLTGDQMAMLTALNQPVVQALSLQISAWLDADVSISILAVERQLYQHFLRSQDLPAFYLTRAKFRPMGAVALLGVDLTFADVLAHYSLGGTLVYNALDHQRTPTTSDLELLDAMLTRVWAEANQIWAACQITAEFEERVTPVSINKVLQSSDNLLVFTYSVMIAGVEASMQLCLPGTVADWLLQELHQVHIKHNQPPEVQALLAERLGGLTERLTMQLPSFRMRVKSLSTLKVGDLIDTGIASNTLAELSVCGGVTWQSRACKLDSGRVVATIVS